MILLFYRSSAKSPEDDGRLIHHFRRSLLPFYPDDKFIQLWTRIIYCSTFISTILYPLNFGFTSSEIVIHYYILGLVGDGCIDFGYTILYRHHTQYDYLLN